MCERPLVLLPVNPQPIKHKRRNMRLQQWMAKLSLSLEPRFRINTLFASRGNPTRQHGRDCQHEQRREIRDWV